MQKQHDKTPNAYNLALMSFLIRPATEHDLPEIQNIYNAEARSISGEMHSSFMALRQLCPMNIQAQYSIAEGLALWRSMLS